MGRRRLLLTGAVTAAVITTGAFGIRSVSRSRRQEEAALAAPPESVAPVEKALADPNFVAAPFTRSVITANEDFYTINTESRAPVIEATDWSLLVTGLVENELELSYDQLLDMDSLEYHGTLQCISNEVGGDLISTTLWQGIPMRSVLERAVPTSGAVDVVLVAIGGYSDSITFTKAMEDETLLAYSMNGSPLPAAHGFPIRAYIPNIYGMKNVKWLREIKLVDSDYQGYWQRRGWSDDATIKTTSAIDMPNRSNSGRFDSGSLEVGGIAFAGNRGIGQVEYQVDADGLWLPAALEQPLSPTTWIRWKAGLDLEPGRHELEVRAVDEHGGAQEETETATHPDGAGGYHRVAIRIES